ncbi:MULTISPECIES: YbaB/EbfC family nucleoid-associated protein [unclassified Nonomuraea]|uniref:YbaB/EbfC family nucleoid-associated protein n=1 Tax=Nonomuraea sp. NPDC003804 TaxID=3154547 RepID=UPI0033AB4E3B
MTEPTIDTEVRRLLADFEAEMRPLHEARQRMADVRGHGEAADGLVRLEVVPGGALSGLTIDPRAMRLGSAALAEAVLEAARAAAADAATRVSETIDDTMAPYIEDARRFYDSL